MNDADRCPRNEDEPNLFVEPSGPSLLTWITLLILLLAAISLLLHVILQVLPMHALFSAALGGTLSLAGILMSPRWTARPLPLWARALTVLAGAAMATLGAWDSPPPGGVFRAAVLAAMCAVASAVDLADRIIPNELLVAACALWLAGQALAPTAWLSAVQGAAFGFGVLLAMNLLSRGGMGMGDVKMAGVMGLFLGWPGTATALVAASVVGGTVAAALLLSGRARRNDAIPFGPFLALGAASAMMMVSFTII